MKEKEKKIEEAVNKVAKELPKYLSYVKNLFKKFINSVSDSPIEIIPLLSFPFFH